MDNGKKILGKCFSVLLEHWEWICLIVGACLYLLYVLYMYVEVPFESYISKFYLIDLLYTGELTLNSLLTVYGANGMLASNIYFLINIKLFGFSVLAENLMNVALVVVVGYVAIKKYAELIGGQIKKWYYYVAIVMMTIFLFTCMQQGGGGMSLQVRFGLTSFVVVSYMIDRMMLERSNDSVYYILTIIAMVLSINVFGSGYSFAGIPFIVLSILVLSFLDKKVHKKGMGIIITYVGTTVLYFVQYGFFSGTTETSASGGIFSIFSDWVLILKEFMFWCGSCVFGRALLEDGYISEHQYLFVGVVVFILILFAIYLYFKTQMYRLTYLPVFWIGYFITLFGLLYIGRSEVLGVGFTTNSWYTVHTKVLSVAIIGIFVYAFIQIKEKKKRYLGVVCMGNVFLCIAILIGTTATVIRLPHEKNWIIDKQAYFFVESKEELPVDVNGMTPLFQDVETSWEAIETLKKYRLSIFRDYGAYELMQEKRAESK